MSSEPGRDCELAGEQQLAIKQRIEVLIQDVHDRAEAAANPTAEREFAISVRHLEDAAMRYRRGRANELGGCTPTDFDATATIDRLSRARGAGTEQEAGAEPEVICTGCFRIRGCDPEGHRQLCQCEKPAEPEEPWPGYDFNTYVELCYCCGIEPLQSGQRFSMFFCDECNARVHDFHENLGHRTIPIGRHTLMNGVLLNPDGPDAEADLSDVERFAANMNSLVNAIDRLSACVTDRIRENIQTLGLQASEGVNLAAYLDAARTYPLEKQAAFTELARHFTPPHAD